MAARGLASRTFWLEALPQWAQCNGLSPGWSLACRISADDLVKRLPLHQHWYGFSSVRICGSASVGLCAAPWRSQGTHRPLVGVREVMVGQAGLLAEGLPAHPVCTGQMPVGARWCPSRDERLLKHLPHTLHTNGFSALWRCWWSTRLVTSVKAWPQSLHG